MPTDSSLGEREALLVQAEIVANLGSWTWHLPTNTLAWSDNVFRILGYEVGEVEPSFEVFLGAVHPEDLARVVAANEAAAASETAPPLAYRILTKQGEVRHVLAQGISVRDDDGNLLRMIGTVQDRTEQRQHVEQLRRTAQRLTDAQALAKVGSFEWVPETGQLEYSAELRRILGLAPDEPVAVDLFESLIHPNDRERLTRLREGAERTGRNSPLVETRLMLRDGTVRHVTMFSEVHALPDGDAYITGAVLDVTDRVVLEAQLRQAQSIESIGRLASGIAHDFNNLMTVIMANACMLEESGAGPLATEIISASRSAADLTQRLLAVGRQVPVKLGPVSVDEVVAESAGMLRRVLHDAVRMKTSLGDPTWALADRHQLQQVLLNLVINARDAIEDVGTIVVETGSVVADGETRIVVRVRDDGLGMDDDTLARAFEPFFTTKAPGKGTGLGLAMVRGIVDQLGGQVQIDSTPNVGTTVSLFLQPSADGPSVGSEPDAAPSDKAVYRILIVEDEPGVRRMAGRVLASRGYLVELADGPPAARAALAAHRFDLVLSDIAMPEGGGRRVVADARAADPTMRVLLMTGYDPREDWIVDRVMQKPFTPHDLVTAVSDLLGGPPDEP